MFVPSSANVRESAWLPPSSHLEIWVVAGQTDCSMDVVATSLVSH